MIIPINQKSGTTSTTYLLPLATTFIVLFSLILCPFSYAGLKNGMDADVVVGQPDFASNSTTNPPRANTLGVPRGVYFDGKRLFIGDDDNNRVLIYNSIPSSNNASADVVIGQQNFSSNAINQGGGPRANTLYAAIGVYSDGYKLITSFTK